MIYARDKEFLAQMKEIAMYMKYDASGDCDLQVGDDVSKFVKIKSHFFPVSVPYLFYRSPNANCSLWMELRPLYIPSWTLRGHWYPNNIQNPCRNTYISFLCS